MNVPKDARMTVHGRVPVVARVRNHGWRVEDAALAAGIAVRRWRAPWRTHASRP